MVHIYFDLRPLTDAAYSRLMVRGVQATTPVKIRAKVIRETANCGGMDGYTEAEKGHNQPSAMYNTRSLTRGLVLLSADMSSHPTTVQPATRSTSTDISPMNGQTARPRPYFREKAQCLPGSLSHPVITG